MYAVKMLHTKGGFAEYFAPNGQKKCMLLICYIQDDFAENFDPLCTQNVCC